MKKKDGKEEIVVADRNAYKDNLKQLSNPEGMIVDYLGQIYVADFGTLVRRKFSGFNCCW